MDLIWGIYTFVALIYIFLCFMHPKKGLKLRSFGLGFNLALSLILTFTVNNNSRIKTVSRGFLSCICLENGQQFPPLCTEVLTMHGMGTMA